MENMSIQVDHSGTIQLPAYVRDGASLIVAEEGTLPFVPKRVFYITNVRPGLVRGEHAHKEGEQVLFCIKGSFELALDDGEKKQTLTLSDPALGIRLGSRLWHVMRDFSEDCVILVFADKLFDEADVLRSYDDFLAFIKS